MSSLSEIALRPALKRFSFLIGIGKILEERLAAYQANPDQVNLGKKSNKNSKS